MTPAVYDLVLYRGDTGRWRFTLRDDTAKTSPTDLTDVIAEAMIRDKAPNATVTLSLFCEVTLPNIIDMELTAEGSRDLPVKGVWDLQTTYPSGDVATVLKGTVTVTQDVTYEETAAGARKRFSTVK
jgi:hypothetical protein